MFARLLLGFLLLLAAPVAHAAEGAPVRSSRAAATLLADTDAAAPGQPFRAALRLRLAPGWHVYWRNPGEAGQATELTPVLPPGTTAGPVQWPAPERLDEAGIAVYGYTGDVLLPFTVTPGPRADATLHLAADASWLVCKQICVPEGGHLALDLPWGAPVPSAQAPLVAEALSRVPTPVPFAATLSPSGLLTLAVPDPAAIRTATFFPDAADTVKDSAPQPLATAAGRLTLRLSPGPDFHPGALSGVVVLQPGAGPSLAYAVTPTPAADAPAAPDTALVWTLVAAFAGGLLLNLMPCVFPVIAMKAAALTRLGGAGRRAVRTEALSYTAGVLVTFCSLGGALALAGTGWGTQFQSPAFVAASAWLLFAVGLNMSGVWTAGASLAGAGSSWASRAGPVGAFFTGALAVLVAAPCTAPFMGTALAAALVLPPAGALAVFAAMGAGLAAPYALLAAAPGVAALLPRPGRWMDLLKGALAFPMYAAAAWLVSVVEAQAGATGLVVALSGLLLVGFAAWAWSAAATSLGRTGRTAGRAVALLAALAAAALLPTAERAPAAAVAATAGAEPFTTARLAALRAENRPVFVDMTAAWCLPCLFNERIALAPAAVRQAFADRNVAVLRGDWTRKDPAITDFLRAHDRDGVPLYLLYGPADADPVVLPQLLTAGIVLDHLARLPPPD